MTRAGQACAYANQHIQAKLADAKGWVPSAEALQRLSERAAERKERAKKRAEANKLAQGESVPDEALDGKSKREQDSRIQKDARWQQGGDLSANAKLAAEAEVRKDWTRDAKKILAGAPMPQYRQRRSLALSTISGVAGVVLRFEPKREDPSRGQFFADLHISSKDSADGGWMTVPIAAGTWKDKDKPNPYLWPRLHFMADGSLPINLGRVIFKPRRGKTLLQLTYKETISLPAPGGRVATIGIFGSESKRLLLRDELHNIDFTSYMTRFLSMKQNFDGLRRRVSNQIGRKRRGSQRKHRKFLNFGFRDFSKTLFQQLAAKIMDWCKTEHVGTLQILDLQGGDWPEHEFKTYLTYMGDRSGVQVIQVKSKAEMEAATEPAIKRAVKREAERKRKSRKKLGDAMREIAAQRKGDT